MSALGNCPNPLRPNLKPVDGLSLWQSEGADGHAGCLSVVRLDANERMLIPFTTTMLRVLLHYLDYPAIRGYVHCGGADCLLCRVGRQPDLRDLWPLYDVVDKAVGVLAISPNLRPMALRPQLSPLLQRLQGQPEPMVIALRRQETGKFAVNAFPLPQGAEDGAAVIRAFLERLAAGQVDLASVYPRLSNADLAGIADIATLARLKGIALS